MLKKISIKIILLLQDGPGVLVVRQELVPEERLFDLYPHVLRLHQLFQKLQQRWQLLVLGEVIERQNWNPEFRLHHKGKA